jgi:hypothetical protein
VVTIGSLVLFSTDTGDAWVLDPAEQPGTRLAVMGRSYRASSRTR